jgi:aspartate/methionine/tyrosine aminotransferase
MTQALLFELLTDPISVAEVDNARDVYGSRQARWAQALDLPPGDGINTWLAVADEREALVQLGAAGIRVAPGAPFQLGEADGHVRVTVGVTDEIDAVAAALGAVRALA